MLPAATGRAAEAPGPPQAGALTVYRGQAPDDGLPALPAVGPELTAPGTPSPPPTAGLAAAREPASLVLGVSITGNKKVRQTEMLRHIKTRKERNYDEQLVQEDVRRLYATGKFQNVRVHKQYEAAGVYVTFEVVERPMIDGILFIGNRYVTDKKLLKESGLKQGEALNIYTVQEARRKVEEFYRSKGYCRTVVTIVEGDKPEDRRVVLRIDESPIERIWAVRFVGNDPSFVTDARLKTLIQSKPGFAKYLFGGKVDPTMIAADREKLETYYRNLGYFKARISREITYDASGQWATLTFVIDEGPRYRIRDLSVVGNQKYDSAQLLGLLKLQRGDYFNLTKMQIDENALRDAYGSQGHIFANIKASPRFLEEPGQLDLVYQIEEGDMFRVGKINIHVAGDSPHTRRDVVLNRLSLRPGDVVDIREVRASERRLKASDLFITNPADGDPPRIVIRPPDLSETATLAERPSSSYRGQSPDDSAAAAPARLMILDVFVPPLKSDPR